MADKQSKVPRTLCSGHKSSMTTDHLEWHISAALVVAVAGRVVGIWPKGPVGAAPCRRCGGGGAVKSLPGILGGKSIDSVQLNKRGNSLGGLRHLSNL